MSNVESQEVGRLPLLKPSELVEPQAHFRDLLAGFLTWAQRSGFRAESEAGELLGPFNALLYSPKLSEGLLSFIQTEGRETSLTPELREVVILSVGSVWNSDYELYAHRVVARSVGILPKDVDLLSSGDSPKELGQGGELCQRFVLALVREHRISDELYTQAEAYFGPKTLIDMICLAGLYMTVSALLNAFEVPVV